MINLLHFKNGFNSIILVLIFIFFLSFPSGSIVTSLITPEIVLASEPTVVEFPFYSGPEVTPQGITLGPDGNIWFTESGLNKIGRSTPDGNITEFSLPSIFGNPLDITSGPDGNLWYTHTSQRVGRITPNGSFTEFLLPLGTNAANIVSGSDGNLWFSEIAGSGSRSEIGRITPTGSITKFPLPTSSIAHVFASGSDGNLWYTEYQKRLIGKISITGEVTEFQLAPEVGNPIDITGGPDGNQWFTTAFGEIGKITSNGEITIFSNSISGIPYNITSGTDGDLWFSKNNFKIGRITTEGEVTEYPVSTSSFPSLLSFGSDGNLWFTIPNRIGRINIAELTNPSTPLADFKQTDPQWSTAPDSPLNNLTHLNHSLSCGDMYGYGCAVTSVADVFYTYDKTILADSSTQLHPGSLNDWLSEHNGYSSCSIIWGNAATSVQLGAPVIIFRNNDNDWVAGQQAIDTALAQGNLPIIGVTTSFGTHFFVVSKKLADANGNPDYSIIDPALYPFTANNPGNSGKSLRQVYGGFDKVFETVIYKKNTPPQKTLTIRGHSPIQLEITDPLGNVTGYVEATQEIAENIENSSYGTEYGISPVDGQSPTRDQTKYFQEINPTEGEYTIRLIGTGDGSYTLDFSKTDEEGNVSIQEVHGIAQDGVIETFQVQYTSDATQAPVVKKEVTFQNLKDYLNEMRVLNLITQENIANSLLRNIEQAEKAALAGDTTKVVQNLNQFINILERERGKRLTEEGYKILIDGVNYLKTSY